MDRFKRYLLLSQVNLFAWLLLSSIIVSSVVFENGGISNYGNHYSTVIFFSIAFIVSATYIHLAAESLKSLNEQFEYLSTLSLVLLLVFVTTFPRRFGFVFSDIHDYTSIFLFAYELLLVVWLVFKRPMFETFLYASIMVAGSAIGLLSAVHIPHLMLVGQMVGAIGFALLLVLVLPKVLDNT